GVARQGIVSVGGARYVRNRSPPSASRVFQITDTATEVPTAPLDALALGEREGKLTLLGAREESHGETEDTRVTLLAQHREASAWVTDASTLLPKGPSSPQPRRHARRRRHGPAAPSPDHMGPANADN